MIKILVVEDDENLRRLFCTVLNRNGFHGIGVSDGEQALEVLEKEQIALVISDIMMPHMDGYELTKTLRSANYQLPILMITAKEDYVDKQRGFLVGTDDYMVKPIDVNEMVLRVNALLRRAKIVHERKIAWSNTTLDYDTLTVTVNGQESLLPQKEFQLLYKLLSYPKKIFTRQQLMDEIWGMDSESYEKTINVHINRIRDRFKHCSDFEIITIRGLGYKAVKHNEK